MELWSLCVHLAGPSWGSILVRVVASINQMERDSRKGVTIFMPHPELSMREFLNFDGCHKPHEMFTSKDTFSTKKILLSNRLLLPCKSGRLKLPLVHQIRTLSYQSLVGILGNGASTWMMDDTDWLVVACDMTISQDTSLPTSFKADVEKKALEKKALD